MKELSLTNSFLDSNYNTIIPAGEYVVEYIMFKNKIGKNNRPYVMMMFKIIENYEYSGVCLFDNFFFVAKDDKYFDRALYKYKTLTYALGLDDFPIDAIDVNLWFKFKDTRRKKLIVNVINTTSKEGKVYNNIANYHKYFETEEEKKNEEERLQRAFDPQIAELTGDVIYEDEIPF